MTQVWLEHDSDWIYEGGPTGNLHDVYFNQLVPLLFPFLKTLHAFFELESFGRNGLASDYT